MALRKAVHYRGFHSLLKLQNSPLNPFTLTHLISSNTRQSSNISSIFQRPFSHAANVLEKVSPEFRNLENDETKSKKTKIPLDVLFKEAVGIIENPGNIEIDIENDSESDGENGVLKKRLRRLEEAVKAIKEQRKNEKEKMKKKGENGGGGSENEPKRRSLYGLFRKKGEINGEKLGEVDTLRMEDPRVHKELSDDMIMFVAHLYTEGYFKDSNFLPKNKFDVSCFENSYARDFVKFAAEQFGKDNQEIAKWLSGSDLKKVALFGCPSLARKHVFSAKRLRTFFRIPENIVCEKCAIKDSCKFVNQNVWKTDTKSLNLAVVMRLITLYALEAVPPQLVVPEEVKTSVSNVLKEVVKLSKTVSKSS